jgi:sulfite reductase (NADPH) hemoprotein beta-component
VHDIGVHALRDGAGEIGFRILVGGGLGRTPVIGHVIREFLPREEILNYLDAILRVYNRFGRRDNIYKARVKILVKEMTLEVFTHHVETEWQRVRGGPATVPDEEIERIASFRRTALRAPDRRRCRISRRRGDNRGFATGPSAMSFHTRSGYAAVTLSLKKTGVPPGDATSDQMDAVADLADAYSFGEIRVSHEQNLIFAHVKQAALLALWGELMTWASPPRTSVSSPTSSAAPAAISARWPTPSRFRSPKRSSAGSTTDYLHDIGEINLNISGCMNACGHHHVGNIGVLGVDKNGAEWYQVSIGGAWASTRRWAR